MNILKSIKLIFWKIRNTLFEQPRMLIKLLKHKELYKADTYYPNEKYKSTSRVVFEQIKSIYVHNEINRYYFLYGFDVKGLRNSKDYVPYSLFMKRRNFLNGSPKNHSVEILRDKLVFFLFAKSFGFSTPENVGILQNGEVFSLQTKKDESFESFLLKTSSSPFFIKIIDGQCGVGIFSIIFENGHLYVNGKIKSISSFLIQLGRWRYLIQMKVIQHREINRLHADSVNTMRIVSVNNNGVVNLFSSFFRVGVNGSNVDNTSCGGLVVNIINDSGQLNSLAFYMPGHGTTTKFHPNSNILFSEFIIPHYKEAVSQVLQFHNFLPQIHSIGWDVAITENGPCIIEGNDRWEMSGPQTITGLSKEFEEMFH